MKPTFKKKDAKVLLKKIKKNVRTPRLYIYQFWATQAYKLLDCKNLKVCIQKYLKDIPRSTFYKELTTAKLELIIGGESQIGDYSTYALEPLKGLTANEIRATWRNVEKLLAAEQKKNGRVKKITQRLIKQSIKNKGYEEHLLKKKTSVKPKDKNKVDYFVSKITSSLSNEEIENLITLLKTKQSH